MPVFEKNQKFNQYLTVFCWLDRHLARKGKVANPWGITVMK